MKKILGLLLVFALSCFVPAMAAEEVVPFADAKVQITVPDKWVKVLDKNTLKINSADNEMAVVFMILNPEEADKVLEKVDADLDKAIGEITWGNEGKSKPEEVNGMKGEIWNGTAKEGKFQVECVVLDTPAGKKITYYWFDTPESEKKYEKDIETIVNGLKPLEAAAPAPAPAPAK